jgi:hypothetical protein
MKFELRRLSVLVPIVAGIFILLAIVAVGSSQTNAASGGIVAKAPIHTPKAGFGAPAAARRTGCPVECADGRGLLVNHFDGLTGTERFQQLCLPPPAWENHCILQDDRGTQAAGHEQDNCCPLPEK